MTNFNEDPYTVTSWGVTNEPFDMVTPSGQRCLVRKLEMEDVLAHGLLNDLDSFSSNLLEESDPSRAESSEEIMEAFKDEEKFSKLGITINKIIMITVLKPMVFPVPESVKHPSTGKMIEGERIPGRVYVDKIGFMDKMSIFQAVFEGMKGLERFREGQEADLGTVENVEAVPETSERTPGDNPLL